MTRGNGESTPLHGRARRAQPARVWVADLPQPTGGRRRGRAGSRSGSGDLREARGSALVLVEHFVQVVDEVGLYGPLRLDRRLPGEEAPVEGVGRSVAKGVVIPAG